MNVVVTTIFPPTKGTQEIALRLGQLGGTLWAIGDAKGPAAYDLPNTRFVPIEEQRDLDFSLARILPERHYTRKNLGYLLAIGAGATEIVETDDDNIPTAEFWEKREAEVCAAVYRDTGWLNVYRLFTDTFIWPRGYPLENLHDVLAEPNGAPVALPAYIQQGLADENPDVDAVYRLTRDLPVSFDRERPPVHLGEGCWCPFNSQNTTFFREAFPLLYLPSQCSFRMTDIWRSFVAQRCLWAMGSGVVFHRSTVYQERNEHNLLRDFADEVPGYLSNELIRKTLEKVSLRPGQDGTTVADNLVVCYEALVRDEILPPEEMPLVEAWVLDVLTAVG